MTQVLISCRVTLPIECITLTMVGISYCLNSVNLKSFSSAARTTRSLEKGRYFAYAKAIPGENSYGLLWASPELRNGHSNLSGRLTRVLTELLVSPEESVPLRLFKSQRCRDAPVELRGGVLPVHVHLLGAHPVHVELGEAHGVVDLGDESKAWHLFHSDWNIHSHRMWQQH